MRSAPALEEMKCHQTSPPPESGLRVLPFECSPEEHSLTADRNIALGRPVLVFV